MAKSGGVKLAPIVAGYFQFRHVAATPQPYLSSSL
jgi:hypothetical protein